MVERRVHFSCSFEYFVSNIASAIAVAQSVSILIKENGVTEEGGEMREERERAAENRKKDTNESLVREHSRGCHLRRKQIDALVYLSHIGSQNRCQVIIQSPKSTIYKLPSLLSSPSLLLFRRLSSILSHLMRCMNHAYHCPSARWRYTTEARSSLFIAGGLGAVVAVGSLA